MPIDYHAQIPALADFVVLFETTGWNEQYRATPAELQRMLEHSWLVLCAYDGGWLVGVGRVVSDLALHAMIYDLIVHPDYQGRGIGGTILEQLVSACRQAAIRDIQLFCARGKRAFYEKRGFVARPDDAPGMVYRPG